MVKKLSVLLVFVIFLLAYKLLSSEGGMMEYHQLSQKIAKIEVENRQQQDENNRLKQKVYALQHNPEAVETLARQKLGMIGENEVFIQVIEQPATISQPIGHDAMPKSSKTSH